MTRNLSDGERDVLHELAQDAADALGSTWADAEAEGVCAYCNESLPSSGEGCPCGAEAAILAALDAERDAISLMERQQREDDERAAAEEARLGADWCLGHMARLVAGKCPVCAAEAVAVRAIGAHSIL